MISLAALPVMNISNNGERGETEEGVHSKMAVAMTVLLSLEPK